MPSLDGDDFYRAPVDEVLGLTDSAAIMTAVESPPDASWDASETIRRLRREVADKDALVERLRADVARMAAENAELQANVDRRDGLITDHSERFQEMVRDLSSREEEIRRLRRLWQDTADARRDLVGVLRHALRALEHDDV